MIIHLLWRQMRSLCGLLLFSSLFILFFFLFLFLLLVLFKRRLRFSVFYWSPILKHEFPAFSSFHAQRPALQAPKNPLWATVLNIRLFLEEYLRTWQQRFAMKLEELGNRFLFLFGQNKMESVWNRDSVPLLA